MLSTSRALLLVVAAGLTLGACASTTRLNADGQRVEHPRLPTEQYVLRTEEQPQELQLAPHDYGLSTRQQEALRGYAAQWRAGTGGDVLIEASSQGGDNAYITSHAAAEALQAHGVPADAIRIIGYTADAAAPIRLSFLQPEATVDRCGRSWDNLASTGANIEPVNFGCAFTANRAVMIANPADIVRPRDMTPVDGARRQTVLDKYRAGQVTTSERDEQASGAVSTAVQ